MLSLRVEKMQANIPYMSCFHQTASAYYICIYSDTSKYNAYVNTVKPSEQKIPQALKANRGIYYYEYVSSTEDRMHQMAMEIEMRQL